jgi:hypothetical protein
VTIYISLSLLSLLFNIFFLPIIPTPYQARFFLLDIVALFQCKLFMILFVWEI